MDIWLYILNVNANNEATELMTVRGKHVNSPFQKSCTWLTITDCLSVTCVSFVAVTIPFMTCHMTCTTSGVRTVYPTEAPGLSTLIVFVDVVVYGVLWNIVSFLSLF